MDFFAQQDAARRNTRLLVVLFIAAVLLLIALTNAAIAAFLFVTGDYDIYSGSREGLAGFLTHFSWSMFTTTGLAISGTVLLVVLFRWLQLSTGGKVVAEGLGATRILPQTGDAAERRCINVVEEMALAANMPVPAVYVLNGERGINAFAAGITPADAVVAVTRGAIEQLRRHELQGVIAHEFSHILNGDMRLNIRLAALLKGITFIGDVGRFMLRSSSRVRSGLRARKGEGAAVLPLMGLTLWVLGALGGLAAAAIKAAISRQKEFLADASAVQFTRSPDGIGDALKVIGGYLPGTHVHAARASDLSHMFFARIEHRLWQLFPTHPPLRERIARLDPRWDGQYIKRKAEPYGALQPRRDTASVGVGRAAVVAAAMAGALQEDTDGERDSGTGTDDLPTPEQPGAACTAVDALPLAFVEHSHEPLGAQALVFSLLMGDQPRLREAQLGIIAATGTRGLELLVNTLYPGVTGLGSPHRLPLLELCLPALKSMSATQYRVFRHALKQLIEADGQVKLHEWCLYQLLRHYLDPEFIAVTPSRARYRALRQVDAAIRTVLSLLAHEGSGDAAAAFRLGADSLDLTDLAILPREACTVNAFSDAVHTLADCYPLLKPRVLKAMTLAAASDGRLSAVEWEIIASTAAVMDCPLPSPMVGASPAPATSRPGDGV